MSDQTTRPVVPLFGHDKARHRRQIAERSNVLFPKDGTEAMTAPLRLKAYLEADLPDAALWTGGLVYITDLAKVAVSDGATWQQLGGGGGGTAPTLFQDLSGRDFAGEPGALAANDDWANTTYEYTRQFAPTVGTMLSPEGDPAKPAVSQPNPNNLSQYLVVDTVGFSTAYEDATFTDVFIAKGTDLSGMGGGQLTMNAGSGTQATPRTFWWWDPVTPANIEDIKPWDLAPADVVLMPRMVLNGMAWIRFIGLTADGNRMARFENGTNNCLWYRCEATNFDGHCFIGTTGGGARPHHITAFECYVHDSQALTGDLHAFLGNPCDQFYVISCAGKHAKGDFFQLDGNSEGCIIEDCDYWMEDFVDSAGNPDPNGAFVNAEGFIDVKSNVITDPLKVYGNRCWDMRRTLDGQGGGMPCRTSNGTDTKFRIDARWNIFSRCWDGGIVYHTTHGGNMSTVRNIIDDIKGHSQSEPMLYYAVADSEAYLNTLSNTNNNARTVHFFTDDPPTVDNLDFMGNLFIDTSNDAATAWNSTGELTANSKVGYNTYVGQYIQFNKGYGGDNLFPGAAGKTSFGAGDFKYRRKKLTAPEIATISGIVPTSTSIAAMGTLVPTSGADQLGSRPNIGVDDAF